MGGEFNCVEDIINFDRYPVPKNKWGYTNRGLEYLKTTHELSRVFIKIYIFYTIKVSFPPLLLKS